MAAFKASLETLPLEVLEQIHIDAQNTRLSEASPTLCRALASLRHSTIAAFYIHRYRQPSEAEHVLTLLLKHRIVDWKVAQFIIARAPPFKTVRLPPRLIPSHGYLDRVNCRPIPSNNKLNPADGQLLRCLLNNVPVAQRYRGLLHGAVENGDIKLAALLMHLGVHVKKHHVVPAILSGNTLMVKILCQHPLRPHRLHNDHGITLGPHLLFAAMSQPEVAAYFAAVLDLERRHSHLKTRAVFDSCGKFKWGHNIGK